MKNLKHFSGFAVTVLFVLFALGVSSCKTVVRQVGKGARAKSKISRQKVRKQTRRVSRIGSSVVERTNEQRNGTETTETKRKKPREEIKRNIERIRAEQAKTMKNRMIHDEAMKKAREKQRQVMERIRTRSRKMLEKTDQVDGVNQRNKNQEPKSVEKPPSKSGNSVKPWILEESGT